MVRIKVWVEFEGNENYQLARERFVQLDDEAILSIAKAIESRLTQRAADEPLEYPGQPYCPHGKLWGECCHLPVRVRR